MSASFCCEVNLRGSVSISGVGVASASAVSAAEKTSEPPTVGGTALKTLFPHRHCPSVTLHSHMFKESCEDVKVV